MKVYAFDVDETLEVSNGPVLLKDLMELRNQGHVVGICGNWGVFIQRVSGWQHLVSFINCCPVLQDIAGNVYGDKAWFLTHLAQYLPAEEYVMVGNVFGEKNKLGFICGSHDSVAAEKAKWRFIKEDAFSEGVR